MKELIAKCVLLVFLLALIVLAIFPIKAEANEEGILITEPPSPTTRPVDIEKQIWSILREEFNETATAAIMGNLQYESALVPYRYESLTVEESGNLNARWRDNELKFVYSKYGYGLAMWTGCYNLQKLWNYCEEHDYEVDSVEGQVRFLLEDYAAAAPMSFRRMALYDEDDIVSASEDFRQSYEKAVCTEYGQYKRAKYAKTIYAARCEDIYKIETVAKAPYSYDIYEKVKALNKRLEAANG